MPDHREPSRRSPVDVLIVGVFVVLVAWFLVGPTIMGIPETPIAAVSPDDISPRPLRTVQSDRPVVMMGGFEMNCMECHAIFDSQPEVPGRPLSQHRDIVLDHGLNDRCFNCHDNENRNTLALRGGNTIPFTEVARLCAKCHGPTYRDWQRGMHGKTMGHWAPQMPRYRLRCSECHDPHSPALDPLRPLPAPHTHRMGDQHGPHVDELEQIDPLRKWRGPGDAHPPATGNHDADHAERESPSPAREATSPPEAGAG